jgi:hypothetical protein
MARTAQSLLWVMTPPLVSIILLCCISVEAQRRIKPESAEPFHAKARDEINSIAMDIRSGDTLWNGVDTDVPAAATQLLKPNVILSRRYIEQRPDGSEGRFGDLLIVQCRDARDMQGHYPPICYPANGDTLVQSEQRDWQMPASPGDPNTGIVIMGMEYTFVRSFGVDTNRRIVYNFFVIPNVPHTCRDIDAVYKVGEDYQRRYYGSAEFQLVMPAELTRAQRDEMLVQLLGPYQDVILSLESESGGMAQ